MGYALRRQDDEHDYVQPAPQRHRRVDRWVERIKQRFTEALSMSAVRMPRFSLSATLAEIQKMGRLAENWDGHGGGAVPELALRDAKHFAHRLDAKFGSSIPSPTIGSVGGGLTMIWRVPMRSRTGSRVTGEFEIEIAFYEHHNEWAVTDRDGIEETKSGENADDDLLVKIVDRYVVE